MSEQHHPVDIPGTPRYLPPADSSEGKWLLEASRAYNHGYNADRMAPYDQRHQMGLYKVLRLLGVPGE